MPKTTDAKFGSEVELFRMRAPWNTAERGAKSLAVPGRTGTVLVDIASFQSYSEVAMSLVGLIHLPSVTT
jgi:hypothetical protein